MNHSNLTLLALLDQNLDIEKLDDAITATTVDIALRLMELEHAQLIPLRTDKTSPWKLFNVQSMIAMDKPIEYHDYNTEAATYALVGLMEDMVGNVKVAMALDIASRYVVDDLSYYCVTNQDPRYDRWAEILTLVKSRHHYIRELAGLPPAGDCPYYTTALATLEEIQIMDGDDIGPVKDQILKDRLIGLFNSECHVGTLSRVQARLAELIGTHQSYQYQDKRYRLADVEHLARDLAATYRYWLQDAKAATH